MRVIVNNYVPNACVVYLTEGRDPSYIDAHRDAREPDYTFISVVVKGFVKRRSKVHDDNAPAHIISIMRAWARGRLDEVLLFMDAEDALFEGVQR